MQIVRGLPACLVLLLITISASAGVKDQVEIDKINDKDFGTWAGGDGAQTVTDTLCVSSSNYSDQFNDPPPVLVPPAVHMPYKFKATDRNGPIGYYLYLDGDDGNTGNKRIQVRIEHRDTKVGTSFETLIDDVYDSHAHTGQFKKCLDGDNTEMRITLTQAQLEQARAGQYTGRFEASVIGGSSGTKEDNQRFDIDIEIASAVRISGLDNIDLGQWAETGDITAIEPFCVFNNNDTPTYNITITSPNQYAGGKFRVVNGGATAFVPYVLQFKADLTPGGGTTVTTLPLSGTASNSDITCGGTGNAKVTVSMLSSDLILAPIDAYSDTLTLRVEPI